MSPAILSLATLSLEYCKVMATAAETAPRTLLREVLRYLPRIYMTTSDLTIDGEEPYETGAIYDSVTEDQYNTVRDDVARALGQYDVFLDTSVADMQYSDTPVAVSLAELLADVFQNMADFAATMAQADDELAAEIIAELKYRFDTFLADTICRALRAANYAFYNADFDQD